jgi:monoamine oxidase
VAARGSRARAPGGITRRRFVVGAASAGALAGALAPSRARAAQRYDADVIVVGAGLAGLHAAVTLQGEGATVRVLEGSRRIGGRVYTLDGVTGHPEAGGSEVGADYARIRDMMRRLGGLPTERFVDYFEMSAALHAGGAPMRLQDWATSPANPFADRERAPGPGGPFSLNGLYAVRPSPLKSADAWLDLELARQYDIPHAAFLKSRGASDRAIEWIGDLATPSGAGNVSTLWQMKSSFMEGSGGLAGLERLRDGMSRLTDGMAGLLQEPVQTGTRVARIAADGDGLVVQDARRRRYRAKHVVCTVPLTMLRDIAIEPAPPALQAAAIREVPYSNGLSVFFHVDKPFWEEDGLPASLRSTTALGNVFRIRYAGGHILWNHRSGPRSAPFRGLTDAQVRARATDELHAARPSTRGRVTPLAVVNWDRYEWTRGHLAFRAPGQILRFGKVLGDAHGRIHFAGEHTAVTAAGMEGAMESGERAAFEILTAG